MSIIPVDTFHHLSIIISLYWTSETLFSSSITTSKYLICDTSTVTSFYISIISSPIFTVTSLNMFLLSRLQMDIFFATLLSIANLFIVEPNQGLLGSSPHLNCFLYLVCPHIPFSFPSLWSLIFYNFMLDGQILHKYNSFFFYLLLLYMGPSSFLFFFLDLVGDF